MMAQGSMAMIRRLMLDKRLWAALQIFGSPSPIVICLDFGLRVKSAHKKMDDK